MVDTDEIIILSGEEKQIILSGLLENYSSGDPVDVHLVGPDGIDTVSSIYASSSGEYYMPIIINDSWISGSYTAYVTYHDFLDEPSVFEVINNTILVDDSLLAEETSEIILQDLKNYSITLDTLHSADSVHYVTAMNSYSGKTPITISLNGELLQESTIYSSDEGLIDYYLLLDETCVSGNYIVSYIENNISIISGNVVESAEFLIATNHYISLDGDLEIFRNSIVESGGEISIFLTESVPNFVPSEIQRVVITVEGDDFYKEFYVITMGYGFYSQNFMIDETLGSYDVSVKYGGEIIESYNIDVLAIDPQWLREHTESWVYGKISDYSYFQKLVLMLDDDYTVTPNVSAPDWFVESAAMWMRGMMDDDSFNGSIKFLAENRLLWLVFQKVNF